MLLCRGFASSARWSLLRQASARIDSVGFLSGLETITAGEIVIGVPTYNNATTIPLKPALPVKPAIPPLTQMMLALGVGAQHYAIPFVAVLLIAGALLWRWGSSESGGIYLEHLRSRIPLFGDISLKYQVAVFSRMLATLLSGSAVLPQAQPTDIYLTALAIVLTVVYAWGLIMRPRRQVSRMGIASLVVLVLYVVGICGLFEVASH